MLTIPVQSDPELTSDLGIKLNLFWVLLKQFLSNLSPIGAFWKSNPRLTFNNIDNSKFYLFRMLSEHFENLSPSWPLTLKVSSIYLECYWDHSCQIWAQSFWKADPIWRLQTPERKMVVMKVFTFIYLNIIIKYVSTGFTKIRMKLSALIWSVCTMWYSNLAPVLNVKMG